VPRLTKKVPVLFPEVRRSVGIITPKNRELSPAENAFRQFTIRFFSQLEKF
jgi:LysR family transcriptional activator of glutamate synthase operon